MSCGKNDRVPAISKPERLSPGPGGSPSRGEAYGRSGSSSSSHTNKYSSSRSGSRGHSSNSNYNDFNRKSSSSYSSSSSYEGRRGRDNGRDGKFHNNRSGHNSFNDYPSKYKHENNRSRSRYNNSYNNKYNNYDKPPISTTSQLPYDRKTTKYDRGDSRDRYNNRNRNSVTQTPLDSQQLPSTSGPQDYKDPNAYSSVPPVPSTQFPPSTSHFLPPPPPHYAPPSSMGAPSYATPSTSQYSSPYPPSTPSSFPQSSPAYSLSSEHSQYYTPQYYDPSQSPAMPSVHHLNTLYHQGYGSHPTMSLSGMPYPYQPQPPVPKEAPPKPTKPKVDKNEELITSIVNDIKANGVFDQLRKMCLNQIETKEPYKKVVKHLTATVENIIKDVKWTPDLNANKIRDKIRKTTLGSKYFQTGLDSVVNEIVNKDADPGFTPLILESVTKFLGAKEKKEQAEKEKAEKERLEKERIENEKKEKIERANKLLEDERLKKEKELNEKLEAEKKQKLEPSSSPGRLKSPTDDNFNQIKNKNGLTENDVNGQHVFAKPKTPPPEEPMDYESESEDDEEDESPNFESLDMVGSPLRVTREEIEEKFSLEMQEELRLAAMQQGAPVL